MFKKIKKFIFGELNVAKLSASFTKLTAKLEEIAAREAAEIEAKTALRATLEQQIAEHGKEAARAKAFAENINKLVGAAE